MVVLFGILNNKYIATHTSIPFSDYFDPRLLHDLANELQVQVVSCNGDGLRYAFILDRGQLGKLPTHIDFPFVDDGKLLVGLCMTKRFSLRLSRLWKLRLLMITHACTKAWVPF